MNILRPTQTAKKVGLSRSTLWRMETAGKFPRRIQLSAKAVGYDEAEIDEWLNRRARRATAGSKTSTSL